MTVLEYDVISVVHVSSDSGNHFPVLFCDLHRVEHSALVFSDKVLNVCVEWLAKVITFDMFSMMVDEALEQMRTMLDSNEAVQKLIANEAGEGSE